MKGFACVHVDEAGDEVPNTGCGEIDCVIFDGYLFGDRLLEGTMFKAFVQDGEIVVEPASDDDDDYLSLLNKQLWLDNALEFAKINDIATCPKCGQDVDAQPRAC